MRYIVIIYKDELASESVANLIRNTSIQIACPIFVNATEKLEQAIAKRGFAFYKNISKSPDLFPLYTILASVGWNKNDDVFEPEELVLAKDTPIDKPFNIEHIPAKIIGHITGSWLVDDEMEELDTAQPIDSFPAKFHDLTSAVIYRHLKSLEPELEEAAAKLIEEIKSGDWCVSMECIFTNFDYAMQANGVVEIVHRKDDTAFLTKHLRVYGGTGVYNNKKVGRVLRNITFSGKGLVKKPANPESVVFTDTSVFNKVLANILQENKINMTQEYEAKLAELATELEKVKASLAEKEAALAQIESAKYEDQLTSLKASLEIKESELVKSTEINSGLANVNQELSQKLTELETVRADFETKLAAKDQELVRANEELSAMKAEAIKISRINSLTEAKVELDDAKALVEKFAGLSDEQFSEVVNVLAKKNEKECKDKKSGANGTDVDDRGETVAQAGEAVVDTAIPEPDPTLGTDSDKLKEEERHQVAAHLQGYLTHLIRKNRESK